MIQYSMGANFVLFVMNWLRNSGNIKCRESDVQKKRTKHPEPDVQLLNVGNLTSSKRSWILGTIYSFSRWRYSPTKLLPLTSQTKLTLTLTLTLTLLNPNICAHIVDTHIDFFPKIYKRNFMCEVRSRVCSSGK